MKSSIAIILLGLNITLNAQETKASSHTLSIEIGTGIGWDGHDFLVRNIRGFYRSPSALPARDYRDYSDREDHLWKKGRMDFIEATYQWNPKNSIGVGVQYFHWQGLYGWKRDYLESWKDLRTWKERYMFNLMWYRSPNRFAGNFQYGIGIVYQMQFSGSPKYSIHTNESVQIGSTKYENWFPDIGIAIKIRKYWPINDRLKIGLTGYTHVLNAIGIESIGILASTKIDLSKIPKGSVSKEKKKRKGSYTLSMGSGPLILLRYVDILKSNTLSSPGYVGNETMRIPMGKLDRIGLSYSHDFLKATASYSTARYKEYFGQDVDPAAFWSGGRNVNKMEMLGLDLAYMRKISQRSTVSLGAGIVWRKDHIDSPFYTINVDGTLKEIGATILNPSWEAGIQGNMSYTYDIGHRIGLGILTSANFFDNGRGLESLPVTAFLSIDIF